MLVWIAVAAAFPSVTETLSDATMDWTSLELRGSGKGSPPGGSILSLEAMESEARANLGPRILKLSHRIRISATQLAGDLFGDRRLGYRLDENLSLWEVFSVRYYTSGRVEVEGALPIHDWLRPALVTMALGRDREGPPTGPVTGLVVDARGLAPLPAVAPMLLDEGGLPVYGISMVTEAAISQFPPAIYVVDPADPVGIGKAGSSPLLVKATNVVDAVNLQLDAISAAKVREEAERAPFLLHGAVVIVVDQEP